MRNRSLAICLVVLSALLFMSASRLFAQPGIDLSAEDQEAQEQLRLLEIMKTAPPAPNPPPTVIFSDEESSAPEFRGTVVYDPVTGEEIAVPAPDAGVLGPVEPTSPCPMEE